MKVPQVPCSERLLCASRAIQAEPLNCLALLLHFWGNAKSGKESIKKRMSNVKDSFPLLTSAIPQSTSSHSSHLLPIYALSFIMLNRMEGDPPFPLPPKVLSPPTIHNPLSQRLITRSSQTLQPKCLCSGIQRLQSIAAFSRQKN